MSHDNHGNAHPHAHSHGDAHAHDHGSALAAAEAACRAQKINLTPGRRQVLEALCSETKPQGAYDLIEKVAADTGKRPAPISIYRALDFLQENGLVHRLASRNAYIACGHSHEAQDLVVFLICEKCGCVTESASDSIRRGLSTLTEASGFRPRTQVVEVAGTCGACNGSA